MATISFLRACGLVCARAMAVGVAAARQPGPADHGATGLSVTPALPTREIGFSPVVGGFALVMDGRTAVLTTTGAVDTGCDRDMPYRIERQIVVDPADTMVQGTRTIATY